MFYVYKWFNIKTNEVFYIGKGCNNRYKQTKKRNKLFKKYIQDNKCDVEIIEYFKNENDAFKSEHQLIVDFKKNGQCKCNLDDGGKGGCNFIWTKEMKKYFSENNIMKDEKQRKKMSKYNPMYNKDTSLKSGIKHRKPFYIGEKYYQCLKEASREYNVTESAISYWLKNGHNNKELCYFVGTEPIKYDFNAKIKYSNAIRVKYDEKEYSNLKELSNFLNIKYTTLYKYYKENKYINGKKIENI